MHYTILKYLKGTPMQENIEEKLGPLGRSYRPRFLLIIPEWKKLIHEVMSSLSEDVMKQRLTDRLLFRV